MKMNKVVLWVSGSYHKMYQKFFMDNCDIQAIIAKNTDSVNGYGVTVISPDEITGRVMENVDIVLDCSFGETRRLAEQAMEVGIQRERIWLVEDYLRKEGLLEKLKDETVDRQIAVLNRILSASNQEIRDMEFLQRCIREYGLYCYQANDNYEEEVFWTVYGLQQLPEEFAGLCVFLSSFQIDSAMEIGVYRGRSSYFLGAILMRNNPKCKYYMVDISDKLDSFDRFHKLLPGLIKCIPASSIDYIGQSYDFVFIDASHVYDAAISDYESVGKYANKLVAFHDIYAHEYDNENGGQCGCGAK